MTVSVEFVNAIQGGDLSFETLRITSTEQVSLTNNVVGTEVQIIETTINDLIVWDNNLSINAGDLLAERNVNLVKLAAIKAGIETYVPTGVGMVLINDVEQNSDLSSIWQTVDSVFAMANARTQGKQLFLSMIKEALLSDLGINFKDFVQE